MFSHLRNKLNHRVFFTNTIENTVSKNGTRWKTGLSGLGDHSNIGRLGDHCEYQKLMSGRIMRKPITVRLRQPLWTHEGSSAIVANTVKTGVRPRRSLRIPHCEAIVSTHDWRLGFRGMPSAKARQPHVNRCEMMWIDAKTRENQGDYKERLM